MSEFAGAQQKSVGHALTARLPEHDGGVDVRQTPRTPPPGRSSFQDGSLQHIHRFERLLVVRGAPTKAFRDIIGSSMSMLRPVAGPLQVQSLAPPQPPLHSASTFGSSFGAVAEASVAGYDDATPRSSLPSLTTTAPDPTSASSHTHSPKPEDSPAATHQSGTEVTVSLSRSASVQSSRSARSTTSISSNASGTSSRRVYPVYNLEFHNLQHSVIVDAMTDERVARIHKRGVELADFAILDPVTYGQHYAIPTYSRRKEEAARLATATRSEGLSSFTQEFKPSNLLNKFKRFSLKNMANPAPGSSGVVSKRTSLLRPAASEPIAIAGIPTVPLFREKAALGDTSDLSSAVQSAKHAPGYVWLVRSFLRKDLVDASELCDFTIEWRKRRTQTRRRPVDSATKGTQSASQSRRNSVFSEDNRPGTPGTIGAIPFHMNPKEYSPSRPGRSFDHARVTDMLQAGTHSSQSNQLRPEGALAARMLSPNALNRPATAPLNATRRSPSRSQSPAPSVTDAGSISNLSHTEENFDSGEESDPEDSEKPWACEFVVRRPATSKTEAPFTKRVLLGTVTPAPHHPRLVAQMAIPLTLTPINLGTQGPDDIHTISPEEMKDIVTVTGLWLIVREGLGLGGVKSRKNEVS